MRMFSCLRADTISLDEAAKMLLGDGQDSSQIKMSKFSLPFYALG